MAVATKRRARRKSSDRDTAVRAAAGETACDEILRRTPVDQHGDRWVIRCVGLAHPQAVKHLSGRWVEDHVDTEIF